MNNVRSVLNTRYIAPGLAGLALFAAGCGDNDPASEKLGNVPAATSTVPAERPGPAGQNGHELAGSIARISRDVRGEETVPSTFCVNTNDRSQRIFSRKPARLIVNTLCQPPLGEPASVYQSATSQSKKLGKVHDGDVVMALCIDPDGQSTTNVLGGESASETWVKISTKQTTGFISEVNLAYVQDSRFKTC